MTFKLGVLCSFGLGGADRCCLNILKHLNSLNIEYKAFYTEASIPKFVPGFHPEGYSPPSRMAQFKEICNPIHINNALEINNYNISVLHTHRSGEDIRLIPSLQDANINFKVLETNFHGATRTRADLRVFVSEEISRGRGQVIPNAISLPETNENLREHLSISDKFVFGKISRPDNDVYSPISLQAYKLVENENTAFLYVGTNPKAIALAKELDIKNIIFMDPVTDISYLSKLYNTMDLFCHSNGCGETFGNTIAEAFMHDKPAISHKGGANHWTQAHRSLFGSRTDLYVDDRDVNKYSALMNRAMTDKAWLEDATHYLSNRAKAMYETSKIVEKYIEIYKSI